MNKLVIGIIATLFATNASAAFRSVTVKESNAVYEEASALFTRAMPVCLDKASDWLPDASDNKVCAFPVFLQMLAGGWIQAHKEEALQKAAKRHEPLARPEDIWELPYANSFLGCMSLQFDSASVFAKYDFQTFLKEPLLNGWIEKNKDIGKTPEGKQFLDQLSGLTEYANKCENIVRDQTPEGSIDV